jgi:CheY-like chemotaxis protein
MNTSEQFSDENVFCSDADFATFNSFVEIKSEQEAEQYVRESDEEVQKLLETDDYGDEHRMAILILLQSRNYFARLAELEQVGLPAGFNRGLFSEEPPVDPLADKHVAVYASGRLSKTLVHVLEYVPLAGAARTKAYSSVSELLEAILDNQVAGVLALHAQKGSVIDSLKHDYKNLPGKSQRDADIFVFPPCVDVSALATITEMATKIRQLSTGERVEVTEFNLQANLPHLLVHAVAPQKSVNILIVDDVEAYAVNMQDVLRSWPNVSVEVMIHEEGLPPVPTQVDIVLLDEAMSKGITGQQVHENWSANGFTGVVVSTTGGEKPSHVKDHFGQKASMVSKYESAMAFVQFMNRLLSTR